MNYELAKKLKDAGFPQDENFSERCDDVFVCCIHQRRIDLKSGEKNDAPYMPTLEELIDACGDEFHCLIYTTTGGIDSSFKFWSAGIDKYAKDWSNGKTPIEAVANLWLVLNSNAPGTT